MKDLFIPYEQALDIKELGFEEPCFAYYGEINGGEIEIFQKRSFDNNSVGVCVPLYQQVFDWFRTNHNLLSWIYSSNNVLFWFTIIGDGRFVKSHDGEFTYEEAKLECLKQLIEIVKTKEL